MHRIYFSSLTLLVSSLFIGQCSPSPAAVDFRQLPEIRKHESSPKATKLLIDEQLTDYINAQAKLDGADQVILIADTIIFTERVTLHELDLIIAADYFSTAGRQVAVLPAETNSERRGLSGKPGKDVHIIARHVDRAQFHLPGRDGTAGSDGPPGENGNKNEFQSNMDVSVSRGTPGTDGQDGGNGGNGGKLTLHTQNRNFQVRLTAPGGRGGAGGKGGTGGTTFIRVITGPVQPDPIRNPPGNNPIQPQQNRGTIRTRKEKDGKNGSRGRRGIRGREEKKIITDQQFAASVREFYHHDWEYLDRTGWQILFSKK
jgi:hypothetical protein